MPSGYEISDDSINPELEKARFGSIAPDPFDASKNQGICQDRLCRLMVSLGRDGTGLPAQHGALSGQAPVIAG